MLELVKKEKLIALSFAGTYMQMFDMILGRPREDIRVSLLLVKCLQTLDQITQACIVWVV